MKNNRIAVQVAKTFRFAGPVVRGQILRALERQQHTALGQACLAAVAYVMLG